MSSVYRIEIDSSLCSGFGTCAELAPDVIRLDRAGTAEPLSTETDDELVLAAAKACPMGAIAVFEIATGRQAA